MAGSTRLELATSGVTGRRSNQLNYDPAWSFDTSMIRYLPRSPDRFDTSMSWSDCPIIHRRYRGGRYRIRTCDSRRVKPVLYH
jgi:hypothetical protein